jgi:PAS domain S-box-containing protein
MNPAGGSISPHAPPAGRAMFVAGLLLILVAATAAIASLHVHRRAEARVSHTLQITGLLRTVRSRLQDAETGQLGYTTTGDEAYLGPYHEALQSVPPELDRLAALAADNLDPQQVTRLRYLVARHLQEMKGMVDLHRTAGSDPAARVAAAGAGKATMDRISAVFRQMEHDASLLLAQQEATHVARERWLEASTLAACGLGLLMLLVGNHYAQRSRRAALTAYARLRDSQQRIRANFENAALGIVQADTEDRVVNVNQRFCGILGRRREELLGKSIHELTYGEDQPRSDQLNQDLQEGRRQRIDYEKRYVGHNGKPVWVHVSVSAIRDAAGRVTGYIGTTEDISQRKAAEGLLRESEERFRMQAHLERLRADAAETLQRPAERQALLQAVAGLLVERLDAVFARIWTLDATGQILELQASAGLYTHLDGPHGRVPVGQLKIGLIAQERKPHVTNQVLGDPRVPNQEWAQREGLVAFAGYPLLLEGRLLGVVALFARHELSSAAVETLGAVSSLLAQALARKQAEAALRESENQFREAFDHAPAGLVLADLQGRFLHVNPAYCDIVGYSREELLGRTLQEFIHPEDLLATLEATQRLRAGTIPAFFLEKRYVRKDGDSVWVQVGCTLRRQDGKPSQQVVIVENIDLRKRAESALAAAKEEAERATKAKDHFLAVLSHELRTPLTPVLASISMLLEDTQLDAEMREGLEMIRRNAELEARLIDDLLDVTRIARGKIELYKQPVRLDEIIRRAVEVCQPDIEARRLHFGVKIELDAPCWVKADAARLQQVFWNLLKNAIKFTPNGGYVGIRCHPDTADGVVVEVNDSGIGIEPAALDRIFNAFEQAERSMTRRFGGLGLGLAISRALVEMHDGSISAHSAGKEKGASFRVHLPVLAPQAVCATTQRAVSPGGSPEHKPAGLRLLYIEDHGDTARTMKRLLERHGHQVQTAGDVATALQIVDRSPFDLLISDLGLPDGSGADLMREVRARHPDLKGIALSGYGMEADVQRSREAGFAEHLTKPVRVEELQMAISRVANR